MPPKPSKKAERTILIEIFLQGILDIALIPFVISNNPVKKLEEKDELILKKSVIGENILFITFNNPLALKIEIILEKITTKPPIKIIVETLLVILSAKTSPKLEKQILFFKEIFSCCLEKDNLELEFFFQNLKTIPTLIQAKICVIKSKKPIVVFLNIRMPTVPIINKGPELLVKLRSLSHSSLLHILFILKLLAILAPIGYPLIIPIIKQKAPSPLILNRGFIYLFNNKPNCITMSVCINNSVATKKGKRDGTTEFAHSDKPDFTADKLLLENINRHKVKLIKIKGKKIFFSFKT